MIEGMDFSELYALKVIYTTERFVDNDEKTINEKQLHVRTVFYDDEHFAESFLGLSDEMYTEYRVSLQSKKITDGMLLEYKNNMCIEEYFLTKSSILEQNTPGNAKSSIDLSEIGEKRIVYCSI